MKTQTVWVLPDNNNASSPITWVDPDNPTFQNSRKGEFIPCEAKILNTGSNVFFPDDDDGMADVPYETKTIIIEKLMPIKGCRTSVSTEISTTGTAPNLNTSVSIKKKKYPQSYVFLKKPTFSGGSVLSTKTQDLQFTDMENWDIQIFLDCDYSAAYPGASTPMASPLRILFKTPDGRMNYFVTISKTSASTADSWNGRKLNAERPNTSTTGSVNLDKTLAVDNKVTTVYVSDLPSTFFNRFYNFGTQTDPVFYNGYIPQGTVICVQPSYRTYKSSTGQYSTVWTDPIEIGYVNNESCIIHIDKWYELNRNPSEVTSEDILHATLTEPSSGLTTLNTPCWTFLNDIRRVNKGGKMVMKGTIRYLSYMADLQPEGDDYRDFEPYEIGE